MRMETGTASEGKSIVMRCLDEAIDRFGMPRKALAEELSVTEQTLSKMTAGSQAFGVALFDEMPDALLTSFLARYGQHRGFRVEPLEPEELDVELLEAVDHLITVHRLRASRARPAKAALADVAHERRRA